MNVWGILLVVAVLGTLLVVGAGQASLAPVPAGVWVVSETSASLCDPIMDPQCDLPCDPIMDPQCN